MAYSITAGGRVYRFADLRTLMAKASPRRSGDELAGIAAATMEERVAAQMALADLPLTTFLNDSLIPYEQDEVTRLIIDSHDAEAFAPISCTSSPVWTPSASASSGCRCAPAPGASCAIEWDMGVPTARS